MNIYYYYDYNYLSVTEAVLTMYIFMQNMHLFVADQSHNKNPRAESQTHMIAELHSV